MESLGGSTRRKGSFNATGSQRPGSARRDDGSSATGGTNADMSGSHRGRNNRPSSAAGGAGNRSTPVTGGELMGSRRGVMSITKANSEMGRMAKLRVAETNYNKEKALWGGPMEEQGRVNRVRPVKPDLPAFWSVQEHGQPWSDERLAQGADAHWQIAPDRVGGKHDAGPMVEARKTLRQSLESGRVQVDLKTMEPIDPAQARQMAQDEREFLIARMKPHEKLFALRANRDRDWHDDDFQPWTRNIDKDYDREPWYRGMENTIRMALTKLEWIMQQHLQYLSDKDYETFRAPTMPPKHILQRAFKKVDPQGSGYVSIEQFAQLWQNVLNLMDHTEKVKKVNGKSRKVLVPIGRRFIDRNTVAAIFCKYGFNKAGLMPYAVFVQSIVSKNARLLGQELTLDTKAVGRNGLNNTQEIGMAMSGAKIMYTLCRKGVYAPPDFEEDTAFRSANPPRATMWLEHIYGYAGLKNVANNLFYTHRGEIAYYVGMVGVVWNKDFHDEGKPSQRFFFGHNNDITCMAIHPNRRFAATGQQTHDDGTPYLCIWDVDTMCQVQKLVHPDDMRSVVAAAFTSWGGSTGTKGGELVATVTSDDRHTVRIWRWMTKEHSSRLIDITDPMEQISRALYIPGWSFGPAKKIHKMEEDEAEGQLYFHSHEPTPDHVGKGAERPSPPPPFNMANPSGKKSYLDAVYTGKTASSGSSPAKLKRSLSKNPTRAEGDPVVQEFANWALNNRWPKTDSTFAEGGSWPEGWGSKAGLPGDPMKHPLVRDILERPGWHLRAAKGFEYIDPPETKESDKPKDEAFQPGYCAKDKSWVLIANFPGYQGTPPQIYGLQFNPFRNSSGRAGCEFLQYGVKHLKVYMKDEDREDGTPGQWVGAAASFGSDKVSDVFSACFAPAMHSGKSKTDVCIVAGFPNGSIGLFVPPYPTRPGAVYALQQVFEAHHPGRVMTYPADPRALPGRESYSGVRVLCLRKTTEGAYEILSGGACGKIMVWRLSAPGGNKRGVAIGEPAAHCLDETNEDPLKADRIVGMDAYPVMDKERFPELKQSKDEFVAGTDGCDIWEVDDTPRLLIEGPVGDVYNVAPHPRDPHIFATSCDSDEVLVWDAHQRRNVMKGSLGFRCRGIAYSQEDYEDPSEGGKATAGKIGGGSTGFHLAVGGKAGRVAILDAENLCPLVILHDSKQAMDVLRYSPARGNDPSRPGYLAAGSHDLFIYLYNASNNYQFVAKCSGHSGTIETLDWSLPLSEPKKYEGKTILRSTCANSEILHWNPANGKQVTADQRNASWNTYSAKYGFQVMGIWEDGADRTDINSADCSRRGTSRYDRDQEIVLNKTDPESAEWTQGGGYLVTSEDSSNIKIFNFPAVQDDAPYRVFRGHSSHVMGIRFLSDDRHVVSVGAGDRAVMQWRTMGINQYDTEYDWCVMECVDAALAKMADRKGSKIPKPGVSNWKAVEGSSGAPNYGVVEEAKRTAFGGTEALPYKTRSDFFANYTEGMYQGGGDPPCIICSICHGETNAKAAQLTHKDAMFICCCEHGVHTSLNTCDMCQNGGQQSIRRRGGPEAPGPRLHDFQEVDESQE